VEASLLLVSVEVVEHEGRKDSIVRLIRIRKLVRETSVESDGYSLPLGLSPGPIESLRIRVEPDHFDGGIERLHQSGETSSPTADFENTLARLKMGLVDQLSMHRLADHQLRDRVVEGKQPVIPRRGNIASLSLWHFTPLGSLALPSDLAVQPGLGSGPAMENDGDFVNVEEPPGS